MASPPNSPGREEAVPKPVLPSPHAPQAIIPEMSKPNHQKQTVMVRAGFGGEGQCIELISNHFTVSFKAEDHFFYQYNITVKYDDNHVVEVKSLRRKVMDKIFETHSSELGGKAFVYDGDKSLFTTGTLPKENLDLLVVLEESFPSGVPCRSPGDVSSTGIDHKRSKHSLLAKALIVEVRFATKISLTPLIMAFRGSQMEQAQDALRVLNIILRQQQAKRGCLIVKQSYFNADPVNLTDLGGGVSCCWGFHSGFCSTIGGLSLNMDVSATMIVNPGPVIDFLIKNQNVGGAKEIDWPKAKRMLKNLRIRTRHNNLEFKIIGLSPLPCNQQSFPLKVKNGILKDQTIEVTVYDYFKERHIELTWSACLPCLDVGKPKRPNYLPIELCNLIPLQHYTKALSSQQSALLADKSRQKPQERIRSITNAVENNNYDDVLLLSSGGITIDKHFTKLEGRVLNAPTLKVGDGEDSVPKNGHWNFSNKRLLNAVPIERWAIVNFSARCDLSYLSREMINCGRNKGVSINRPYTIIEENHQHIRLGPVERVEKMFEEVINRFPSPPQLLLCVLPQRKNSTIYGPWKKKNLHEMGVVTQCIAPTKITDQYLSNVLLKINSKLDGINSLLAVEVNRSIPCIRDLPTMLVGMDVSHGSPGRTDLLSVAAVVGSRNWPLISRYSAAVRTQSAKVEMIDSLYKPLSNGEDDGMMRDLFLDFYDSTAGRKPAQIIIFRDGVSESQFNQVLNIELDQVTKAFQHLGEGPLPKITIVIAQKNHHTKLFQANSRENVPPGTIVDTKIVHPRNYDFYMCSHAAMIGTAKPTHYHVLLDEIGFTPDDLQKLVFSLSYVYQRSTSATSIVAPIRYAHLAAHQMSQFINLEDFSETSSQSGSAIPEIPRLHEDVRQSMFFC
ncbi:Protein argonaute 16 [Apostasia shenzhenica]|uniref:Protein argonaute 16 n=1 Tax=Apostasia shenzhenica TaxID=1088818 RepID=A0A2I0A531_9ASPA|nr:Protein argonaute 16 [Apostasia shenzhenica]